VADSNESLVGTKVSATLHTSKGPIRVTLFPDQAPKTVSNFVGLVEGTKQYSPRNAQGGTSGPYYDGMIFHRVIDGFMIQTGDPTGTGRGGPGFEFADEFHPELQFNKPYLLGMANPGIRDKNGSQFFITVAPTTWLNFKHTIFGEVTDQESRNVVDTIATTKTGPQDKPLEDIVVERVTVERG
jgi:peptidyl-prolyl cis-trans isomerase A (cyclophilin A)